MKEEALKLADELDALHQYVPSEAPAMIRRLVEKLDKQTYKADLLENRLKVIVGSKPLSDEEIDKVASIKMNQILMDLIDSEDWNKGCTKQHLVNFARAIEERHGIK